MAAQPPAQQVSKAPPPEPAKAKVAAQALFDFGVAEIRPDGRTALDELAGNARNITVQAVTATGYADRIGSIAYNQALSVRRAEAVKAYLVSKGFEATRVQTDGKGKSDPVSGDKCSKLGDNRRNKTLVACLQPDRRVEIEVIGIRTQ